MFAIQVIFFKVVLEILAANFQKLCGFGCVPATGEIGLAEKLPLIVFHQLGKALREVGMRIGGIGMGNRNSFGAYAGRSFKAGGKVFFLEDGPLAVAEGEAQHMKQFPDVARPAVLPQPLPKAVFAQKNRPLPRRTPSVCSVPFAGPVFRPPGEQTAWFICKAQRAALRILCGIYLCERNSLCG